MAKVGSFSYRRAVVHYSIYGDTIFGYTADARVSAEGRYTNVPLGLDRAFTGVSEAERAIHELCRDLIDGYIAEEEEKSNA